MRPAVRTYLPGSDIIPATTGTTAMLIVSLAAALAALLFMTVIVLGTPPTVPH